MLTTLFFISLFFTILSLSFGLFTFFKGGRFEKYGNLAMRWRVLLQGITLLIFLLLLWLK